MQRTSQIFILNFLLLGICPLSFAMDPSKESESSWSSSSSSSSSSVLPRPSLSVPPMPMLTCTIDLEIEEHNEQQEEEETDPAVSSLSSVISQEELDTIFFPQIAPQVESVPSPGSSSGGEAFGPAEISQADKKAFFLSLEKAFLDYCKSFKQKATASSTSMVQEPLKENWLAWILNEGLRLAAAHGWTNAVSSLLEHHFNPIETHPAAFFHHLYQLLNSPKETPVQVVDVSEPERGDEIEGMDSNNFYLAQEILSFIPTPPPIDVVHLDGTTHISHGLRLDGTALMWAAKNGHLAVIQLLLNHGASANVRNQKGETALLWAADSGQEAAVAFLLGRDGIDAGVLTQEGETVLMRAARVGHTKVAELLLGHGVDMHVVDQMERTALLLAARDGRDAVIQLLLQRGAKADTMDNKQNTPLIMAAWNGHETVVNTLLAWGATVNSANQEGITALMRASKGGHSSIVKLLLGKGAAVNAVNQAGETALMQVAAGCKDIGALELLLDGGADINVVTPDGLTALIYAIRSRRLAAIEKLWEKKAQVTQATLEAALKEAHKRKYGPAIKILEKWQAAK